MKKLNKKGFTLVEMLVVIAIIAVLVAIIVPTTSSATNKAKAATNAANLRTAQAEIGIALLNHDVDTIPTPAAVEGGGWTITFGTSPNQTVISVPAAKAITGIEAGNLKAEVVNGEVVVKYGDAGTIAAYAAKAEGK